MNSRAHDDRAFRCGAERCRNELTGRREDNSRIEWLRMLVTPTRPLCAQRTRERLRPLVIWSSEREDALAARDRYLHDQMSGGAEAVNAQALCDIRVAGQPER